MMRASVKIVLLIGLSIQTYATIHHIKYLNATSGFMESVDRFQLAYKRGDSEGMHREIAEQKAIVARGEKARKWWFDAPTPAPAPDDGGK